jgi:hypothetical protein
MSMTYLRSGLLAVAAAAAAIGLAGCGGSSAPHVASLSGSSGHGGSGSTTTTLPKGDATQLLDEWATCMRAHGDPDQVDPTIDANKVIHITYPPGAGNNGPVDLGKGSNDPCGNYLTAASTALRGGQPVPKPDPAKLEKFAQCMRASGIPDFPDPSGGGLSIQTHPGSDLNPSNPTFKKAAKRCGQRAGVPLFGGSTPPAGSIEATSSGGPGGGPGGNGGAGAGSNVRSVSGSVGG